MTAFFSALWALTRKHYVLFPLFLLLFVVFAGGAVLGLYRMLRGQLVNLPGVGAAAAHLPVK